MSTCPFCNRDPFHYVDNGVGMEAVAVTCCDLGDQFFRGMRPAPDEVVLEWHQFEEIGGKLVETATEIERLRRDKSAGFAFWRSIAKRFCNARKAAMDRAIAAESELSTLRARVREVVGPFAKAGELFGPRLSEEYDQCIYSPAAGDEYSLCGDHLRAARLLMEEVK